ncbi:hypothetical protein Nepgr_028934 [Nepenthes gracilis]|uniref:Uncharacterized protein n=1 Tax=Nepenthes gracilis TaxID=150966 RepID=A0AAD3Y522_NEPGR|nr:hypothetical protein Nepgr_028934 [Nepenthes gracilis]
MFEHQQMHAHRQITAHLALPPAQQKQRGFAFTHLVSKKQLSGFTGHIDGDRHMAFKRRAVNPVTTKYPIRVHQKYQSAIPNSNKTTEN